MKKSNVMNIRTGGVAIAAALASSSVDGELLGWLIFRPDTDDFLHSHKAGIGYSLAGYVKNPELGYLFESERLAYLYSTFLDKETDVVPLFDLGDKLKVIFSKAG